MAVIESWFTQERTQPVKVRYLDGNVFSMDNNGNLIGIEVLENGEPASFNGSVSASVVRADGATVAVQGQKDGNKCSVILPQACYAVPGVISIVIKLTSGSDISTIGAIVGNVYQSSTDTAVDPGEIVPSIAALIEEIEEAVDSIPADYSALSAEVTKRAVHFPNFSANALYCLEAVYNNAQDQYTVTPVKSFTLIGYNMVKGLIRIGYNGAANVDHPMPESIVSATGIGYNFAFLCFDLTDTTTATWKIVKHSVFMQDKNLVPICSFYRGQAFFYDDNLKILFKNSVTDLEFLTKENYRIIQAAFYYNGLCNATALIAGRADYSPAEYKITFTGSIFGPIAGVGQFDQSIRYETVVLDWSQEEHPDYIRFIYYDLQAQQLVAYCYSDMTSDQRFSQRLRKNLLALVCAVYQGTLVYTCGACTPGKWFVNGNDIYGGASTEIQPDLYKTFKRVGVVGDSLSVGYMKNKETGVITSRMLAYSWPKKCMSDAGGVPWLNLGTSGQSVLTWCTNATYGKVQAEEANNLCQAYIIGLGENDQSDSARGIPLGTESDIVDDYTHVATTYYGGYARIIQILKHLNPDCKIFCLTNPRIGANRAAYNVAVRYIAGTYYTPADNVFLVDLASDDSSLFNGGTFLPVDAATITGGHYSAVGYTRIASIMEKALTKVIEANQTHFIDVAYIPYATGDPTPDTMTE